jgi:hypothetical protein
MSRMIWRCPDCGCLNAMSLSTCNYCKRSIPDEMLPEPEFGGSEDETKILPAVQEKP